MGRAAARARAQVWGDPVGRSISAHRASPPAHSQRHRALCHKAVPHSTPFLIFSLLGLDWAPTEQGKAQSITQDGGMGKRLLPGCSGYGEILLSQASLQPPAPHPPAPSCCPCIPQQLENEKPLCFSGPNEVLSSFPDALCNAPSP